MNHGVSLKIMRASKPQLTPAIQDPYVHTQVQSAVLNLPSPWLSIRPAFGTVYVGEVLTFVVYVSLKNDFVYNTSPSVKVGVSAAIHAKDSPEPPVPVLSSSDTVELNEINQTTQFPIKYEIPTAGMHTVTCQVTYTYTSEGQDHSESFSKMYQFNAVNCLQLQLETVRTASRHPALQIHVENITNSSLWLKPPSFFSESVEPVCVSKTKHLLGPGDTWLYSCKYTGDRPAFTVFWTRGPMGEKGCLTVQ